MEIVDREPNSDNWDFVFTKYEANLNKSNNDSELSTEILFSKPNSQFRYLFSSMLIIIFFGFEFIINYFLVLKFQSLLLTRFQFLLDKLAMKID